MKANAPNPDENNESDIDPSEIDTASQRTPSHPAAPEVPANMEGLTEWDLPPDATGEAAPKVEMEDETPAAELLVEEGVEEADRDQRMAAVDPDFEP